MASSSGGAPGPAVVTKAGEGYDRPHAEQELPIDINYQKLVEWLVQRQKLPHDWHKRLQAIQGKVAEAVKELPAGLLAQVAGSADAPVDYFRALALRDRLAETAADRGERSLWGGLTGQAGSWDKIVKAYSNGGVFIGEAAQTLVQNVDYELPYLRKQMTKCNQQMADADRRHADYVRSAASCAGNYKKECDKLGIAGGAAVTQELRQLTTQLPGVFEQLVQELRSEELAPALSYYQHFTQYAHGDAVGKQQQQQQASGAEQPLPDVLPVLTEVRQRRTQPWGGSSGAGADAANNAAAAPAAIDWGGLDDAGAAGADAAGGGARGGISWDLPDAPGAADGGGGAAAAGSSISWDIALEPAAADGGASGGGDAGAEAGGAGPSLNWDIDLSGIEVETAGSDAAAAAAAPGIDWGVEAGDAGAAGSGAAAPAAGSAGGDASAVRLQHDSDYQAQLLDDLLELRAFLLSRRTGLAGSSSSSDLLRALAPEVVASTDAGDVARMLACVEALLARLNDDKLRQLLLLSSSARYVERLSSSLQRKAGQEAKMLAAAAETQARKHEARATLASLQPKLSEIAARTRTIKAAVEAALAKQFAGRRVNVLGEINNALAGA